MSPATLAELIVGRLSPYSAHQLLHALAGRDDPAFLYSAGDVAMCEAHAREDAPSLAAAARALIPADLHPLIPALAAKACRS